MSSQTSSLQAAVKSAVPPLPMVQYITPAGSSEVTLSFCTQSKCSCATATEQLADECTLRQGPLTKARNSTADHNHSHLLVAVDYHESMRLDSIAGKSGHAKRPYQPPGGRSHYFRTGAL
jgi:hypothetical protein